MTTLSDELTTDPLDRGYASMTDEQVHADLHIEYRTRHKSSLSGDEMFNATDATEWAGLTDLKKQLWMSFCGRESVDPYGTANVAFAQAVFGAGSTTLTNLAGIRDETISRAVELGISGVRVGDIQRARA